MKLEKYYQTLLKINLSFLQNKLNIRFLFCVDIEKPYYIFKIERNKIFLEISCILGVSLFIYNWKHYLKIEESKDKLRKRYNKC